MNSLKMLIATGFIALLAPGTHAQDWFVDLTAGVANVEVDVDTASNDVENLARDDGGFAGTIGGGLFIAESTFVKVSYADFESVGPLILLGSNFEYSSVRAGIGFEFPAEGRWALSIEAGAAFWDVKVRESALFNPGPEDTASTDGTDLYARIGVAFRVTEGFEIGLYGDYESNDVSSIDGAQIGFRFKF